jgi:lysozyme
MKITKTSSKGIDLILHFECGGKPENYLKAYQDSGGTWTIGIGTTIYPNKTLVKAGDLITLAQATEYFKFHLQIFEASIDKIMPDDLTQNQFDALVAFAYNIGIPNFTSSTLAKRISENRTHPGIKDAFLMWNKINKVTSAGLTRRRQAEAWLYTNNELKFDF